MNISKVEHTALKALWMSRFEYILEIYKRYKLFHEPFHFTHTRMIGATRSI